MIESFILAYLWLIVLTIWSFKRQRAYEHIRLYKFGSESSNVVRGGNSLLCPHCRFMVANYTRDYDGNIKCANCEALDRASQRKSWIHQKKRA